MRVLKWLFHPVNLVIIVVLVALYLNRQTLFPELAESPQVKQLTGKVDSLIEKLDGITDPQYADETVEQAKVDETAEQAETGETTEQVELGESQDQAEVAEAVEQTAEDDQAEPSTEVQAAADDLPEMYPLDESAPEESESVGSVSSISTSESGEGLSEGDVVTSDSGETQKPAEPAGEQPMAEEPVDLVETPPTAPNNPAEQVDKIEQSLVAWRAARSAAWAGDFELAVKQYRTLIEQQPDNYDAYGEMGNVLLRSGDKDAAVDAYAEAALLLAKSKYPQVAWRVLEIVSQLDRERADTLYQKIRDEQLSAAQAK